MIHGVGVDIVQVDRIEAWLQQPKLLLRFFNELELELLKSPHKQKSQSLAARFAAKEAFAKALGTGLKGLALKSIWVESDAYGKPQLKLSGAAAAALAACGSARMHLSLSHEREYAVAMVIIEVPNAN
ncbi:MAG: holo-ACP synthase [Spirochaetes bacterium]|nr:holo-ACP synthase [Spirochaetota bacterium]MBU0956425.1 holo-ACP synthase [Spirochaetota bacterium]